MGIENIRILELHDNFFKGIELRSGSLMKIPSYPVYMYHFYLMIFRKMS